MIRGVIAAERKDGTRDGQRRPVIQKIKSKLKIKFTLKVLFTLKFWLGDRTIYTDRGWSLAAPPTLWKTQLSHFL
jgi:hypothetical protein